MSLRCLFLASAFAVVAPSLPSPTYAADPPPAWCATGDPTSVLKCLEAAYDARDISAYEKLLSPDFRFSFRETDGWDRRQDVEQTGRLFTSDQVVSIDLSIEGDIEVAAGPEPDTWILRGMKETMTVQSRDVDGKVDTVEPYVVTSDTMWFTVQLVNDPEPHYVILEWHDPGPEK